jgi:Fic family protein
MQSFRDLQRHLATVPPDIVGALVVVSAARGRQEAFMRQRPDDLESLRQIALVQSAESSNAIENIHAPRKRIEELVADKTTPQNRSEAEIAGYRLVLDTIHANALNIEFEPKYVEQLHGYMARFTGDSTAGKWKMLDNHVEEHHADGTIKVRFKPVDAADVDAAMTELHDRFNAERSAGTYDHLLLTGAYILDFLVIHPFRDGNGRMSRLLTLWLLYLGDFQVGRYISLEKLIEDSKETYYDALAKSTAGWHEGEHDLLPWLQYFLGIVIAAYKEFEDRTSILGGRGSKRALIERFIKTSLSSEFTVSDLRNASPGASDSYITQILIDLKEHGIIERIGAGRGSKWRRLRTNFGDGEDNQTSDQAPLDNPAPEDKKPTPTKA